MINNKKQTKPVMVYWMPEFVARLDKIAASKSQRRNEYIKEAVREKLECDEQALAKAAN